MRSNRYKDYIKWSFVRYAAVIISILIVLFIAFLAVNIQWITVRNNRRANSQLAAVMEDQYQRYAEGMIQIQQEKSVLDTLYNVPDNHITDTNRILYDFTNAQSIKADFVLLDGQGEIRSTNLYEGNREIFQDSALRQSLIEHMKEEPNKIFGRPSHLNYAHDQAGNLILAKAVTDSSGILGYLFFDLIDLQIYEATRVYPVDILVITDRYDNFIFSNGRRGTDPMEKYPTDKYRLDWQKGNIVVHNGKHYHVQKELLPQSDLIIYTLSSVEFQRGMFFYGIIFLMAVIILLVFMILSLTDRVTRRNLFALVELQEAVAQMGAGNMDYQLKSQVFDEFQILHDAYRHIVIQKEELMQHNSELAERKRIMEIKQLEEQFNPHFIFNVMETLRYEIMIDVAKASEMVMAFANLMRYSIYYGNTIVPLQTDIEYINDYLLLQKMRYNRRLQYHIDIPEELFECRIPKLLLQPVVENSLVHGMKNTETICVTITGRIVNDLLELCVEDNGSGIEEEKLDELRAGLEQETDFTSHIGLYNSHRVVRLLYGPEYGMTIQSSLGNGTKVILTIPVIMEDEYV